MIKYLNKILCFLIIAANLRIGLASGWKAGFLVFSITILLTLIFIIINKKKNYIFYNELKWYALISLLAILSTLFALEINFSIDVLWKLLSTFVLMFFVSNYVISFNKFLEIIYFYLTVSFSLAIYNVILYVPSLKRELPLGGVNPVALIMFVSISLVTILFLCKKKKWLISLPIFIYLLLLTESQKSILSLLIMFVSFIIISRKIFSLKYMPYFLILLTLTFYFLNNIELLGKSSVRTYSTIEAIYTGSDVEGAAGGATGEGLRRHLKEKGWVYFFDNPIFGYGLNNFRELYGREHFLYTYSHFTPLELGISFGILGIVFYYMIYVLVLFKNFKILTYTSYPIIYFFISLIIALFVIGLYMQTYFDPSVQLMIILNVILVKNLSTKERWLKA